MIKAIILGSCTFIFSAVLCASTLLGHNEQITKLINDTFFNGKSVSVKKVLDYEKSIDTRSSQVKKAIELELKKLKKEDQEEIDKEIKKDKTLRHYRMIKELISKIKATKDIIKVKKIAQTILEIDYALKVEGVKLNSVKKYYFVKNSLKKWKLPANGDAPHGEASNLINPDTGNFLTQEQLRKYKKQGIDISALNPPVKNSYWTDIEIEKVNVKENYSGGARMYEGIDIWFPTKEAKFKKVRHTQSKPKIDVTAKRDGEKRKFKLKVGSEMHSEITSSSLFAAIGYQTDISTYVRDFKMYLGKKTANDFKKAWNSYYAGWDVDKYIKSQGKDEKGNYIVFTEGLLETKPKELYRVGPWAWGQNGHKGNRDTRGILIFNMWVSNLDLKEAENNKLIVRPKENGEYEMFHLQHDMGFAFGKRFREKPGAFPWELVKKKTKNWIHLNFSNFQQNSGFEHVTYADARWMTRLIARLSRQQISDAVYLGGWPDAISKLLIEKLVARRNQLVEAFDLTNEFTPISYDRNITTKDKAVVDGELVQFEFPGYTQDFGHEFQEMVDPFITGIRNMGLKLGIDIMNRLQNFKFTGEEFGFDDGVIGKIIFKSNRTVDINPKSTGDNDKYLVKDSLKIGLRLGYGLLVSGDASYVKEYTIVYPVKDKNKALLNNNFIVNLFLPFHIRSQGHKLPDKYVLKMEDWVEGRGRFRAEGNFLLTLGSDRTVSKVRLSTFLVDRRKKNKAYVLVDKNKMDKFASEIYAKLLIVKYPIFKHTLTNGNLKRRVYKLDGTKGMSIRDIETITDEIINTGESKKLENHKLQQEVYSNFIQNKIHFNLFNFFDYSNKTRRDLIKDINFSKETNSRTYQVDDQRSYSWALGDNGEKHIARVTLAGKVIKNERIENPALRISVLIDDKNTHTKEIKRYIRMLNKSSLKSDFINFTPELHTKNDLWGNINTLMDMTVYEQGIKNLLNKSEKQWWQALAGTLNVSVKSLENYLPKNTINRSNLDRNFKLDFLLLRFRTMLYHLKRARKAKNQKTQIHQLVMALKYNLYKSGDAFNATLFSMLHKMIGTENLLFKGLITLPSTVENKLPARTSLYNEVGRVQDVSTHFYSFILDDAATIYNLFK